LPADATKRGGRTLTQRVASRQERDRVTRPSRLLRLDRLKRSNDGVELSVVGIRRKLDTHLERWGGVGGEEGEVGKKLGFNVGGRRMTYSRRLVSRLILQSREKG
jgi:hypothetical protein